MTEMIYYYDGSFEGFLCCIFDSYAYKEVLTAIYRDEDALPTLFASRAVQTNQEHANRVLRKVVKCSSYAILTTRVASCGQKKSCTRWPKSATKKAFLCSLTKSMPTLLCLRTSTVRLPW